MFCEKDLGRLGEEMQPREQLDKRQYSPQLQSGVEQETQKEI